ncbi:MAG: histidinol dehydrogenase [Candidatus Adiutrix sp.]|jgi:histidinol dehydrogenase|nr:histidinol dehydrogenase [Candidatus Adiutrix sp.]
MEFLKSARARTIAATREMRRTVAEIIEEVQANGDEAIRRYNRKFDGCDRPALRVSREETETAYREVSGSDLADLRQAAHNIRQFAEAQKATLTSLPAVSPIPGLTIGHRVIPVRSCCGYVPGGGYPLYSTALMLAIPAQVAGVPRVTACSPALKGSSRIHPKTLVALDLAGVDEIYVVGGAQAVAAFSFGTEQIRPVDLIVGPGNSYVTEAKRQCYGQVGIDFVAGPSEIMVIADHTADPEVIAADLLAQSEHDLLAQGLLVTIDRALGRLVLEAVERQLTTLATAAIARRSWADYGEVAVADNLEEVVAYANDRAPEHLEIQVEDNETLAGRLYNYGSLFIGQYSAEVFGDYASGPNHALPTLRAARYTGGVWVGTFLKTCTHQTLDREALPALAPLVARLARGEGLVAHALAAELRLKKFK